MDGPIEHCLSHCPWPTWATCEAIMDDMVGTWILEDFTVERGGETSHPLGERPGGMLSCTALDGRRNAHPLIPEFTPMAHFCDPVGVGGRA